MNWFQMKNFRLHLFALVIVFLLVTMISQDRAEDALLIFSDIECIPETINPGETVTVHITIGDEDYRPSATGVVFLLVIQPNIAEDEFDLFALFDLTLS